MTKKQINLMNTLWKYHIPPKIIAQALGINYPVVTMYCRAFKATQDQHSPTHILTTLTHPSTPGQPDERLHCQHTIKP